ncbi:MAG: CDP-alcohol phosphatidyltransferase family protein [Tahibacter sp.]
MRHLPNLITFLRMLLTVPLVWLLHEGRYDMALGVAVFAGATDALDGFLAKRFGWQSWLGGVLDPVADKLLLVACFVSLAQAEALPTWLAWLVVGRDIVIVAGAVAYHNLVGPLTAHPTWLSKITTCAQITLVFATLVHLSRFGELHKAFNLFLVWGVAALTLASGIDYVVRWTYKAVQEQRRRGGELPS